MRVLILFLILTLSGCSSQPSSPVGARRMALPANAVEVAPKERQIERGQILYVPCYSHVYLLDGKPYNLAITLSVRNTSRSQTLIVRSVEYHDSQGKMVEDMAANEEIELPPLSVAEFFVREDDTSGGSGASFIVDWISEGPISDPSVECAMVGSSGSLGVSFLTVGKVTQELKATPSAPSKPTP